MFKGVRRSAVHGVCAAAALALSPGIATAQAEPDRAGALAFPALPLPPAIGELVGMPQTYTPARSSYLALITSEAEQRGLPAALADAVAQVGCLAGGVRGCESAGAQGQTGGHWSKTGAAQEAAARQC